MLVHRIFAPLKRVLPSPVGRSIRAIATAILTPVYFSTRSGHFRSSILSKAIDSQGNAIPWYTYPAIELLQNREFSSRTILEFGSGQSTLWWAKSASRVVSFEENRDWYECVIKQIPQNVSLIYDPDLRLRSFEEHMTDAEFDVVIVDGFDRLAVMHHCLKVLKADGIIILDNSEGHWSNEDTTSYPIIDLLMAAGMMRVDFYGHSPGNITISCTSIFWRGNSWLFSQAAPPIVGK
jgi:hypothetical protein